MRKITGRAIAVATLTIALGAVGTTGIAVALDNNRPTNHTTSAKTLQLNYTDPGGINIKGNNITSVNLQDQNGLTMGDFKPGTPNANQTIHLNFDRTLNIGERVKYQITTNGKTETGEVPYIPPAPKGTAELNSTGTNITLQGTQTDPIQGAPTQVTVTTPEGKLLGTANGTNIQNIKLTTPQLKGKHLIIEMKNDFNLTRTLTIKK